MSDDDSAHLPGGDAAGPPGLNLARLRAHLAEHLPGGVVGELGARLLTGGRSNLTYLVWDGVRRWAVRRPPLGHVLPTAHDMGREHRVLAALTGTPVPAPVPFLLCRDPAVLGAPFFVMEFVEGEVPNAGSLRGHGGGHARRVGGCLVDRLVELHAVDVDAVGLGDFGRPSGFLDRQLRRWARQLEGSRSRPTPELDGLRAALATAVPVSPAPTLVHGDFRVDNAVFGPDGTVRALLDWEMSTLGDPLTDLGMLLVYGRRAPLDGQDPVNARTVPGFPDEDELVARYVAGSGRDAAGLPWYVALGFLKLAVILEGIHYRHQQGRTAGPGFEGIGDLVRPLAVAGHRALDGG
ncbi:phosphotransferase family protein [Actinoalloteichus caeruleus]|uniref:phosphotransferase family protein n=1 Tax=Actinoalloteichus cyanogriseus TaxID=2893586 RepID=UPI00068EC8F3|nr:phosphotransferase family protein [Actinoalloteichus caeruleus]